MKYLFVLLFLVFPSLVFAKQPDLLVGSDPSTTVSTYMRIYAEVYSKKTGDNIVIRYMPGAGGKTAIEYALKSDREILIGSPTNLPYEILETHDMHWIGSLTGTISVLVVLSGSDIKSIDDIRNHQYIFGHASSKNEDPVTYLLNSAIKSKLKLVSGYKTNGEVFLAADRKEIDVFTASLSGLALRGKLDSYRFIAQFSSVPSEILPDVPPITTFIENAELRNLYSILIKKDMTAFPISMTSAARISVIENQRTIFKTITTSNEFCEKIHSLNLDCFPRQWEAITSTLGEYKQNITKINELEKQRNK